MPCKTAIFGFSQHLLLDCLTTACLSWFCWTNGSEIEQSVFGEHGLPCPDADQHLSAASAVARLSAAHQALTALE